MGLSVFGIALFITEFATTNPWIALPFGLTIFAFSGYVIGYLNPQHISIATTPTWAVNVFGAYTFIKNLFFVNTWAALYSLLIFLPFIAASLGGLYGIQARGKFIKIK